MVMASSPWTCQRVFSHKAEQIGEPELARLPVFQCQLLRLQFVVCQHQLRWFRQPGYLER